MKAALKTFGLCLVMAGASLVLASMMAKETAAKIRSFENEMARTQDETRKRLELESIQRAVRPEILEQEGGTQDHTPRSLEMIVADSSLDIAGLMRTLLETLLPRGSRVAVRVDRFTEFFGVAELPSPVADKELVSWIRNLQTHASEWTGLLRFVHGGRVLAEVTREDLREIRDWASVSDAEVERLMKRSLAEASNPVIPGKRVEPLIVDPADETLKGTDFSSRVRRGEQRFQARLLELRRVLISVIESVQEELVPRHLADASMAKNRERRFGVLSDELERHYKVLTAPLAEYQRLMNKEEVDPIYLQASSRGLMKRYGAAEEAEKAFSEVKSHVRQGREQARRLWEMRGAWEVGDEGQFLFRDEEARKRAEEDFKATDASRQQAESALNAWIKRVWRSN